jgi:hypothetical protein
MRTLANEFRLLKKQEQLKKIKSVQHKHKSSSLISVLLPNYVPHPKMKLWHDAQQTHKGIKGGVRSGKTYTLGAEAITLSYLNRPYYHLSISPSFDNACETYVHNLEELCDTNGLTYEWQKSNNLFIIVWGKKSTDIAKILVHGMDSNFKGVTAASGDLNEPFSISEKSFKVWWERISHPRATRMVRAWGGTAEPDKMQWGWEYFDKEKTSTNEFYSDTLTTYDNTHLSIDYIKGLEGIYTAKDREVYMLGKCINLGVMAVYYAFDRQKHLKDMLDMRTKVNKQMYELCLSFDFNVNPMTCLMGMVIEGKRYLLEEFKLGKSSTRDLCQLVINRLRDKAYLHPVNGSIIITGDASGKNSSSKSNLNDYEIIMEEFDDAGIDYIINVPEANPPVRDAVNYVNNEFEKESMFISAACPELAKDLELVGWKQGANGFQIDKSKKDLTHLSDCLRYFCWNTRVLTEADPANDGYHGAYVGYRNKRGR